MVLAPKKPTESSYADIVKLLKEHYNPNQGVAVKRYKFNTRARLPGESVATYVAELRHLAIDCEFSDALNDMRRDRLVCGVNDPRIQHRLLSEAALDFDKTLATAQAMEMADRDAENFKDAGRAESTTTAVAGAVHKAGQAPLSASDCKNCYRCGGQHRASECCHKETVCHHCGKNGHIVKACRKRKRQRNGASTNSVKERKGEEEEVYLMFPLRSSKYDPIYVTIFANKAPIVMEVDTGATLSVISEKTYGRVWGTNPPPLSNSTAKLRTYTGEEIPVKGGLEVEVNHNGQQKQLPLLVTVGDGPSLIGRNWLVDLKIDWHTTYTIVGPDALTSVLAAHEAVFRDELGTSLCAKAELHMDSQVPPTFHRPRPVAFSMRQKVETELLRLEKEGIIRPRQFSEWSSPIVAVPKKDGTVRICGDYKVSANKAMLCDTHPIPTSEDLFATMAGGVSFMKLDMSHAYLQLELADAARDHLVINTHKGLYEYTRMPFGIKSAPAIFQRTTDNLLQGLDHVCVYIDDILITGTSDEEHLETLNTVLSRLEGAGVHLKKEKCIFLAKEVTYLAHRLNREGIQPTDAKV